MRTGTPLSFGVLRKGARRGSAKRRGGAGRERMVARDARGPARRGRGPARRRRDPQETGMAQPLVAHLAEVDGGDLDGALADIEAALSLSPLEARPPQFSRLAHVLPGQVRGSRHARARRADPARRRRRSALGAGGDRMREPRRSSARRRARRARRQLDRPEPHPAQPSRLRLRRAGEAARARRAMAEITPVKRPRGHIPDRAPGRSRRARGSETPHAAGGRGALPVAGFRVVRPEAGAAAEKHAGSSELSSATSAAEAGHALPRIARARPIWRAHDQETRLRPSRQAVDDPGCARRQDSGPRAKPPGRPDLHRPLHRAGVHLALPGDRPAGLRPSGHRLRPRQMDRRVEVAEALSPELPQSRRLPRGLHRAYRQGSCGAQAALAAGSAATGIRAAASRSTSSGRAASRRRASGCPTRAWRPIAGAAEASAGTEIFGERVERLTPSRRRRFPEAPHESPFYPCLDRNIAGAPGLARSPWRTTRRRPPRGQHRAVDARQRHIRDTTVGSLSLLLSRMASPKVTPSRSSSSSVSRLPSRKRSPHIQGDPDNAAPAAQSRRRAMRIPCRILTMRARPGREAPR